MNGGRLRWKNMAYFSLVTQAPTGFGDKRVRPCVSEEGLLCSRHENDQMEGGRRREVDAEFGIRQPGPAYLPSAAHTNPEPDYPLCW